MRHDKLLEAAGATLIALLFCVACHAAPPLFAPADRGAFAKAAPVVEYEPDIDRDTPPLVIGAWKDPETERVIIANYAEARRIAEAEGRPLVVMSKMTHEGRDLIAQAAPPDAVLTIADDDPRFKKGVYRYQPKHDKGKVLLMQTASPKEVWFFTATWCAACKKVQPLAEKSGVRIIDIDKEPAMARKWLSSGRGIPVAIILDSGVEVERAVGVNEVALLLKGL